MTKYLGYYDEIELIAGCLMLTTGLMSIFSTLTTLWLIRDMKKWNGYLQIIFTLASFQLLFDLQFILVAFYRNTICNRITSFLNIFGGFAVSLWTNVISFLLYMIVKNLQSVNINEYYWLFFGVIAFISICYAILENIYHYDDSNTIPDIVYNAIRAASVFFNFTIHGLISWKLSDMGYGARSDNRIEKSVHDPVRVLSSRIKYYPIVQVITLSGAFWYLFRYSFNTDSYGEHMDLTQKISLCFYAISLPAAGFGYFVIFLLFQPQAYVHFRKRTRELYYRYCCCREGGGDPRREDRFNSATPTELNSSSIMTNHVAENKESLLADTDELDEDQLVQAIMRRYAPDEATDPQSSGSTRWEINSAL